MLQQIANQIKELDNISFDFYSYELSIYLVVDGYKSTDENDSSTFSISFDGIIILQSRNCAVDIYKEFAYIQDLKYYLSQL